MKVVKQVRLHDNDAFRFRVWKKEAFIAGWYAQIKVGNHQWNVYPGDRARVRQLEAARRLYEKDA